MQFEGKSVKIILFLYIIYKDINIKEVYFMDNERKNEMRTIILDTLEEDIKEKLVELEEDLEYSDDMEEKVAVLEEAIKTDVEELILKLQRKLSIQSDELDSELSMEIDERINQLSEYVLEEIEDEEDSYVYIADDDNSIGLANTIIRAIEAKMGDE